MNIYPINVYPQVIIDTCQKKPRPKKDRDAYCESVHDDLDQWHNRELVFFFFWRGENGVCENGYKSIYILISILFQSKTVDSLEV